MSPALPPSFQGQDHAKDTGMAQQPLPPRSAVGNSTDSYTKSQPLNSPSSPHESPTLIPLTFCSFDCRNLPTREHLCADTLHHKYCKVAHSASSNSLQGHPPSCSAEARKQGPSFTDSLAARVLQADAPM